MDTTSYWISSTPLPRFPKAEGQLAVDVVVVGGGIMGLTAAYLLKKAGRTVAVLERGRCACIDTGHTTAHLTAVTDLRLQELEKTFGRDAAKAVWDAGAAAIDQIVTTIRAEDIACDFRWVPGYLHAPLAGNDEKSTDELKREAECARELGIAAEFLADVPYVARAGVKFPHQAIFHPRKYLAALARQIPGDGSHIFENSEASEVEDEPMAVKAADAKIRCRYLVLATHNPLVGAAGALGATLFQTKLALYTSYAVSARLPGGHAARGFVLGYERSLLLPARRAAARLRPCDFRRRGSQDRAGAGHGGCLSPP